MSELKIYTALLKNEGKIEKTVESYKCSGLDDLVKGQKLAVAYEASATGDEYLLRGTASGMLTLNCGKCLCDFELSSGAISFVQSYEKDTQIIDVDEEIRQTVLLNLPMHPVCSDKCKGLCPQCGINLNTATCLCHKEKQTDVRWDKLKNLI